MAGPLNGIRVVDLTQYVAGPFCTMLLGDMGAEIIKVELPDRGDLYRVQGPHFIEGEATSFLSVNRSKKSITMNLKDSSGQRIIHQLLETADVLVENFKPGTLDRLNLGYQQIHEKFPQIIYCSISGYGQTGPDRERGGYDLMAQGRGGIMSVTGIEEGPPIKAGIPIVDMGAAIYAAFGILAAYIAREKTGRGQLIDVALLDTAVSWFSMLFMEYVATGDIPKRMGSASPLFTPYQAFKAQDGYLCVIGTGGKDHWERFCRALGHGEWIGDPRFLDNSKRTKNIGELTTLIEAEMITATVSTWLKRLEEAGLPCEPIQTLDQIISDPQIKARDMLLSVDHPNVGKIDMIGNPIKMSESLERGFYPPPTKGQHTREILTQLGYSEADIDAFKENGVV